jgi:hypothetical protein
MTAAETPAADDGRDRFIPIRKSDLIDALIKQGPFADEGGPEKFRQLCEMLASICHYDYFALLERLRSDYYYFNPEIGPHAAMDGAAIEGCYTDLMQSLDRALKDANFTELPHDEIGEAHRRRTVLRVEIKAPLDDFREVRFYRRGRHTEQFEVAEWLGLRKRKVVAEVFDDVVLCIALKSSGEIGPRRSRALARRKIVPGSILLKCFRNIANSDLHALFPNVRVVMSGADKLAMVVPAIAGGIPILLNLYATITVLFLVVGFYLGVSGAVADSEMKKALAALSGLVALGSFVIRQWVKYQRQSLKYQIELTDNVYYRNINNNAGIFDYVVGAAEDQETKEAFLAYYFLHIAASPPTKDELAARIEGWLNETFGIRLTFEVGAALAKLQEFGLLHNHQGERLFVSPLDGALAELQNTWNGLLSSSHRPIAP